MTQDTKTEPTVAVELHLPAPALRQLDALADESGKDRNGVIVQLAEVAEVLSRPRLRAKYPDLTDERRDQLLAVIRHVAEIVSAVPRTVLLARDPDDESYLNLAVTSGATYLVTRDKDLLDLMGDA